MKQIPERLEIRRQPFIAGAAGHLASGKSVDMA
jgi:hypothetical protein